MYAFTMIYLNRIAHMLLNNHLLKLKNDLKIYSCIFQ